MTLVIVKIVTLNKCGVIWYKITVVAAMLLVVKKNCVELLGGWKEAQTFLEILGPI